ncbi:hypothetical protein FKX85_10935 [Echinicola soli]|uniref:Uncharacterized protein n=1 Tax=Echinicola soli TaxID=2591634 RepID=A0A514CI85_9BACT|nr:hypothetical protein [Echinicola soli]QDH79525.1 hypothetical protein FKX85_10935 [Echinicola soli]
MLTLIYGCQPEESPVPAPVITEGTGKEQMIRLGDQLKNPYSVENMAKAYQNLVKNDPSGGIAGEKINIAATHLYIKFKPANEDELSSLKRDSSLVLYEYPLDYEIEEGGGYYHDPEVPLGVPTYQYVSLPIDKAIPGGVEHEVLAELFIPDESGDTGAANGRIASEGAVQLLVDEALRITGNLDKEPSPANGRLMGKWRPAGRIRVWDDSKYPNGWRAVEGAEVRARRWFTTHKGITNYSGYYSCNGTFRKKANYSIDWERYHFKLREGWLDGAGINGPKQEGNWNVDIRGDKHEFHARVFMAAYHYYYKDIKGLRRPPENGAFKTQLKIRCYYEDNGNKNGNHNAGRRFLGLGSAIKIYNPQNEMKDIYGTTIHELAHASHWKMGGDFYDNAEDIVAESWARGVQWELTRMVWTGYIPKVYARLNYTGIVQDMIDGYGTKTTYAWWDYSKKDWGKPRIEKSYFDQVSGYTIRQLEDALAVSHTWEIWKKTIKNDYENTTEEYLYATFSYWNTK